MSIAVLKQNAEILVEVAENYEKVSAGKKDLAVLNNFKTQFLYLLAAIHKELEKEKNAR